jgi:hypothetical protein
MLLHARMSFNAPNHDLQTSLFYRKETRQGIQEIPTIDFQQFLQFMRRPNYLSQQNWLIIILEKSIFSSVDTTILLKVPQFYASSVKFPLLDDDVFFWYLFSLTLKCFL